MRNGASRYFTLSFYIFFGGAMQKKRQGWTDRPHHL